MKASFSRDVTKLFGLNPKLKVKDYFGGVIDASRLDKKYIRDLRYYFGFDSLPGDVVFITLLRHPKKSK